jgi:exodeoxyribonuclease VII small subunit
VTERNVTADRAGEGSPAATNGAAARVGVDDLTFDDALAELQRTVAELETGGLPLEQSIALYERGVALHERCARLLADAELRVQRLVERAGGALAALDVRPDEAEAE